MNSSNSLCRRSSRPISNRIPPQIPPQTRDRPVLASRTTEGSSSRRSMTVPRATMPANGDSAAPKTTTSASTSAPSLTVVSWDIDGTILRAKGDVANKLHHRAFSHAWKETFGIDFHIREIPHQGSTDPLILLSGVREAVARRRKEESGGGDTSEIDGKDGTTSSSSSAPPPPHRLFSHEEAFALLKDAERAMTSFYESAATDAAVAAEGLELLPGVEALLENLAKREGVVQGLVTGNLQSIGWRKVETLGVAHHFDELVDLGGAGDEDEEEKKTRTDNGKAAAAATRRKRRVGGFGSDHCSEAEGAIDEPWRDRARFIEIAAERALRTAAAAAAKDAHISRRVHIGDTVFDLKAAAEAGALPVGVATGIFSKEELAAARVPGAVILDDLSDLEASLKAMGFSSE